MTDIELGAEVLSKMAMGLLSIFDMDKITGRVSNKNADVVISLVFWDSESTTEDVIPISGFPRKIVAENPHRTFLPHDYQVYLNGLTLKRSVSRKRCSLDTQSDG